MKVVAKVALAAFLALGSANAFDLGSAISKGTEMLGGDGSGSSSGGSQALFALSSSEVAKEL